MSPNSGFNPGPVVKAESVSEQLRRRRGGRDAVPWRRRDWVFAFLAVPLFSALSLAALEAARHAPLAAIQAAVLGALVGAPAGVLIGTVAIGVLLIFHGFLVKELAESASGLGRKSLRALVLLTALTLEWLGSGIGGALGLVINPAFAFGGTLSPQKTGLGLLGGVSGILAVWLWRRVQWSLFRDWQEPNTLRKGRDNANPHI